MKRMRKAGVIDPVTGEPIPFPYMPRAADLPPGWRHFSSAAKMEHLIGLNRAARILSWPIDRLDPLRASYWLQVHRILWRIHIKAMVRQGKFGREVAHERGRRETEEEFERFVSISRE